MTLSRSFIPDAQSKQQMRGLFTGTQLFQLWSEQHQGKAQNTRAGEKSKLTQRDEWEEEEPWKFIRLTGPPATLLTHGTDVKC